VTSPSAAHAADALAWLPSEDDNAVAFSDRAVAAYADRTDPAWAFSDEAGAHADLAISRVASRDIEGAGEALAPCWSWRPSNASTGSFTPSRGSTRR
jgi:hypothetical protein